MILNAPDTPFDIRFRLFRFPVRVAVWFWLVMALLGEGYLFFGPQFLVLWVLCGFVSVLIHELGHAVFIRRFGHWCDIELVMCGGQACPSGEPIERWKRVVISLAGPGFGFVAAGVVYATRYGLREAEVDVPFAVGIGLGMLFTQNLYWSLINLLPIWPLDGGRVSLEACQASSAANPNAVAFGIGFFTAAGLAVVGVAGMLNSLPPAVAASLPSWAIPGRFMLVIMIYFAVENYFLWQQAKQAGRWDREPWQR